MVMHNYVDFYNVILVLRMHNFDWCRCTFKKAAGVTCEILISWKRWYI